VAGGGGRSPFQITLRSGERRCLQALARIGAELIDRYGP
jgi:hypothetical protein